MAPEKKEPRKKIVKKEKVASYFFAVGRRKTATVTVKLFPEGTGDVTVNSKKMNDYFPSFSLQKVIMDPFTILGVVKKYNVVANASGGGPVAQAHATGLGISRALLLVDPNFRTALKKEGLLTRDARKKERKKPGLKRARRAPQWQKR